MKKLTLLLILVFSITSVHSADAQIWKKIKKRAENKVDEKVNDILNKKKKDEKEEKNPNPKDPNNRTSEGDSIDEDPEIYRNFKFIPGEKVIFYDDLKFEEVGEFPSRWDLVKGNSEVATLNGEKVIILTAKYSNRIKPLFDSEDYLGDEFTVEYDVLIPKMEYGGIYSFTNNLFFTNNFNNPNRDVHIEIGYDPKKIDGWAGKSDFKVESVSIGTENEWHHISISYYKGKYKMYYDEKRIVNIPRFTMKPEVFVLGFYLRTRGEGQHPYISVKNIRIAHGGGEMYKRIVADGKYVTNGILFESGKASIKAQSMGIINKVVTVMNENPDWKFKIVGHTDSDGATETNLTLSEQRANAVKQSIVDQGIKEDRFSIEGKGENEPLNTNTTPEEKANNRRVEFIKQ